MKPLDLSKMKYSTSVPGLAASPGNSMVVKPPSVASSPSSGHKRFREKLPSCAED